MPQRPEETVGLEVVAVSAQMAPAGSVEVAAPATAAIPASVRSRPLHQAASPRYSTGHTAFLLMRSAGPGTAAMAVPAAPATAAMATLAARAVPAVLLRPIAPLVMPRRAEEPVGLAG